MGGLTITEFARRIFNFQKAYAVSLPCTCPATIALTDFAFACMQILDELIIAGELQESSKKSVLRVVRVIYRSTDTTTVL